MDVIRQIKADMLAARKAKQSSSLYALILSEIETIGKNDNSRTTTNNEAIALLKKMVARNTDMIKHLSSDMVQKIQKENEILNKYIPKEVPIEEVYSYIDILYAEGIDSIGTFMKLLKNSYGQTVNMKKASAYVSSILNDS